jgi:hypothetical protein
MKGRHGKRGCEAQQHRRRLERTVRREGVSFERWVRRCGESRLEAAGELGVQAETLRSWERRWRQTQLRPAPRGRPAERTDRETRESAMALFQLMGPAVGLAVLQEFFPAVARRELQDLQHRYRDSHLKKGRALVHALRWQKAGRVWAMDHTQPPAPVDGIYGQIFAVRDLGSGMQLMALPMAEATARETTAALRALFREHGMPLVIKSDNGSAVAAGEVDALLDSHGVTHLLSPPLLPSYNGSCEAGIGSLKTRAHHEAARNDRPGEWTCDDVEGARQMANETARPWGFHGPTPGQGWKMRSPVSCAERREFLREVCRRREEARKELGYLPGIELDCRARAVVDRRAIPRTLVSHGILRFRRRRITLPIPFARSSEIT